MRGSGRGAGMSQAEPLRRIGRGPFAADDDDNSSHDEDDADEHPQPARGGAQAGGPPGKADCVKAAAMWSDMPASRTASASSANQMRGLSVSQ